jgi:thiol-disulfide isomerase/thioredoxin
MRQLVFSGAAFLLLATFGVLASLGRAQEVAQNASAAEEKKQDPGKEGDGKSEDEKKKEAAQEEYKKFAEPFFKELMEKLSAAQEGKDVDFGPLAKQYSERLATKSDASEVGDALQAGQYLGMLGSPADAKAVYDGIKKLSDRIQASDPVLAGKVQQRLKQSTAVLDLVGTTPVIEGTLASGEKFDWSKYKGKVVLLDFWATWCGPCVGEIPNVKKAYEKYHEKGFEVVGISLDEDVKELTAFQEKEKLPWVSIFPTGADKGFEAPLAKQFFVNGIPATFLINRDGKLVSVSARGKRLETQLEKLLEKK